MDIITQDARYRQGAVKFSYKCTETEAAIRYKTSERSIYRWRKRYDGTLKSLKDKSRRPKHCNNEQIPKEIVLIKKLYPYYPDKMTLWNRLCEKGYKRCCQTICRTIRKPGLETSGGKHKPRKPKPYKRAEYPDWRQICDKQLHGWRQQVLSTHGSGRMYAALFQGNVWWAQYIKPTRLSEKADIVFPIPDTHGKVERQHRIDGVSF